MDRIAHCSCGRLARFQICKIDRKTKQGEWLEACGTCDSQIGIKNLVTCGHTHEEAVVINREIKKEEKVKQ